MDPRTSGNEGPWATGNAAPAPRAIPGIDGLPLSPLGRPLNILAAEDNRVVQRLLLKYLSKSKEVGKVTFAQNGQEAVEEVKKGSFDLILMDAVMPVMAGFEAITAIQKYERSNWKRRTPIIGMTVHTGATQDCFAKSGMVDDVFCKPIRLHELFGSIRRVLNPDVEEEWVLVEDIEDWEVVELEI